MSDIFISLLVLALFSSTQANNATLNCTTTQGKLNAGVVLLKEEDSLYRYEGELVPNGKGILYYANNNTKWYEGQFKNGSFHGNGTTFYANGQKHAEGEWINDTLHGFTVIYFENGNKRYEGEFKNGNLTGKGILYHDNGMRMYEGEFKSGYFHGQGTQFYYSSEVNYRGDFADGERNGRGISYLSNGKKVYEGEWKNSEHHGKGVLYYDGDVTREKYVGEFLNSKRHGHGTLYRFNMPSLCCQWIEDELFSTNSFQMRLRYEGFVIYVASALISLLIFYY